MINLRKALLPAAVVMAIPLAGCADNYAAEGAGAGGLLGAGVAAVTGGDVVTGAAVGAAAGAAAGYFVDKNDGCDGYNRQGKLDDDCYGTYGYPARRPY
ncbi:hypothetical protein [Novosphingopyxis sp.]|uniref:hypothetical protein n=1 Tax=Novosphingopyxis sp. TaxID=2709690 RepID=UPI003B5D010C